MRDANGRNEVILVTGASRGIGRATAVLAAREGWAVAVNYNRDSAAAEQTVKAVREAGGDAVALQADVAIESDVVRMFDECDRQLGPVSFLVNNAGIQAPSQPLSAMTYDRITRMYSVHVIGTYLCCREAIARMSTRANGRGGAIVNLSSLAAVAGGANAYVDYAGAKGAIDSLTVGLARELAVDGIRVNAVRPGLIDTEIHASGGRPWAAQKLAHEVPIGRAGTATEVAECIVWLLGDSASYVTAAIVNVGGGR